MGFLRYIIQGAGWEIGRTAAREGIEALDTRDEPGDDVNADAVVDPSVARRRERQQRVEARRRAADLERQLAELKKKAGR